MPDYQNGKIYTIRCRIDVTKIYVGSTTTTLSRRIAEHRWASVNKTKTRWYNEVEDWEDWYIELYEDCPCENKEQLCRREGEVIREIGNLNHVITGKTVKEYKKAYREENKEKITECRVNYWLNVEVQNKDEINRKQKENREKRGNIDEINKKRKEYREANKDEFNCKEREYRAKNKDELCRKAKEYYEKKKLSNN